MRKKFAYTETLSTTGAKNIALPGIGEISEGKMMLAMMVIIIGFLIHASLQVHIAALLAGLVVLAIPETSVGFDKTLAGIINYYFGKKEEKEKKKKVIKIRKPITIPKELIILRGFLEKYGQSIAGVLLTVVGIWLSDINISAYFVEIIVLLVVGLVLILTDYLLKIVR